jgi:glyoxylase-like metal-dependent hydrolase (beta-lactamase superfamily II)
MQVNVMLHAIRTGLVAVKKPFLTRQGGPIMSRLRILTSSQFTEPLPVLCWLLEHPEGDLLVDAGVSGGLRRPGYLESLGRFDAWLARRLCTFEIPPGEEIELQLPRLRPRGTGGLRAVMTHLHLDHADGLVQLPGCPLWVNEAEWKNPAGAPKKLLAPFKPELFSFGEMAIDVFGVGYPLTRAGDVIAVPTPGHTPHHCSILVRKGKLTYFIAGDAVYNQHQLLVAELAGGHADAKSAAETIAKIRDYTRRNDTVLLPSHDPDAPRRLIEKEIVPR